MRILLAALLLCLPLAVSADPQDHTIVGQWKVMNLGDTNGVIMSFRGDDHSARMLVPMTRAQISAIPSLPEKTRRMIESSTYVDVAGKQYVEFNGHWSVRSKGIHVALRAADGSEMESDVVPRFNNPDSIQLLEEGKQPAILYYLGLPLPRKGMASR